MYKPTEIWIQGARHPRKGAAHRCWVCLRHSHPMWYEVRWHRRARGPQHSLALVLVHEICVCCRLQGRTNNRSWTENDRCGKVTALLGNQHGLCLSLLKTYSNTKGGETFIIIRHSPPGPRVDPPRVLLLARVTTSSTPYSATVHLRKSVSRSFTAASAAN